MPSHVSAGPKFSQRLRRAAPWIAAITLGVLAGLGAFTFLYAKGGSYLVNDPAACANCHVMRDNYSGWQASSHHAVATCNDCHTPAPLIAKYLVKAENGFRHSWAFTTGRFHEPIQITPADLRVAEGACRNCHTPMVQAIDHHAGNDQLSCIRCHSSVGHLENSGVGTTYTTRNASPTNATTLPTR